MTQIFLSSDYHFNHNRDFIYKARGFDNIYDMNEAIIERHNKLVSSDDIVYVLGDLCLGGGSDEALRSAKKMISSMKGTLKIIYGNHDTLRRLQMYNECWNVELLGFADMIKYNGLHFYISHYPTLTANLDDDKPLKTRVINLYGHTHQREKFHELNSLMYNVGVDSHDCAPVLIDDVIIDIKQQYGKR